MRAKEIIACARGLKSWCKTNDPYEIAQRMGIEVLTRKILIKGFVAQTIKVNGNPTIISINDCYTEKSKKVLCAHELGHAIFHENCVNYFAGISKKSSVEIEREANLFAVALLAPDDIDKYLVMPLEKMDNYSLKAIMDLNIEQIG